MFGCQIIPLHPLHWHLWCMCALCPEFLCPKFLLIFLQTEEYFGLYKILGCIRYMTSLTQTVNSFNAKQIKFYFVIKSWCEQGGPLHCHVRSLWIIINSANNKNQTVFICSLHCLPPTSQPGQLGHGWPLSRPKSVPYTYDEQSTTHSSRFYLKFEYFMWFFAAIVSMWVTIKSFKDIISLSSWK